MLYTITPVYMGAAKFEKSEAVYRRHFGVKEENCFVVFLLRSESELIMVDSGPPRKEINDKLPMFSDIPDYVPMEEALGKVGVKTSDITKIILTHLHWDHCYNLDLFPNTPIYVQRKEITYAVAPIGPDIRMFSALPDCGNPGWFDGWGRFVVVDGDVEVAPGVKVYLTPGHSPGSHSVLVETKEGPYLIPGDFIPKFENFTDGVPNGIHGSIYEWYDNYNKIKNLTENVLPAHDMAIFNRKVYG
ncbi:N-acyl homoserine lactonase family protein [Marasmitruncus massiliensis]|uniref:N-acyl homoserine lactonase family protein n=1 Tax=Marasmitruncus massiliensis TaxID=1944642 RepID=UPI0015E07CB2|nr:N-acyl homoserine lactonase family protein [Marasmitruncus massiliensis]